MVPQRAFPGSAPSGCSWPDVEVAPGVHHDVQNFLFREALLLDNGRYREWLTLLAQDVSYRRSGTFGHKDSNAKSASAAGFVEEDRRALESRVDRLSRAGTAASEQTAFDFRRFITNVIVCAGHCRNEYSVHSHLLVTRTGTEDVDSRIIPVQRHDHLRRAAQSYRIVRRHVSISGLESFEELVL